MPHWLDLTPVPLAVSPPADLAPPLAPLPATGSGGFVDRDFSASAIQDASSPDWDPDNPADDACAQPDGDAAE